MAGRDRGRRLQPARAAGRPDRAPGRGAAGLRQVPAPDRHDVQPALHRERRWPPTRPSPASCVELLRAPLRSRARQSEPASSGGDLADELGPTSTRVASLDEDRILRAFLAPRSRPRCAPTPTAPDRDGALAPWLSFKLDPASCARPAAAAADVRDLGVRAARRGRAPARRRRRPRRHPLVRPREDFRTEVLGLMKAQMVKNAVIVPVGRQGRLRREAAAAPTAARSPSEVRRRATARSSAGCSTSPTTSSTARSCPPPAGRAPRRRRSLPRGRGRQGHGHLLRRRQRHRRRVRLLARRRLRVRRLVGLRPQGDGHHRARAPGRACGATSRARASTPTPRRSRSSASATCPATCSATACCCSHALRLVAAFDHRHVFLDPTPTRTWRGPSASGSSTCPARRGTTTTAR